MKQVAGQLRLDLSQYRELEAFAKFGSDLDKTTQAQLRRGQVMMELLKQDQYSPIPVEKQVAILFVGINGYLDDIEINNIRKFEADFYKFIDSEGKDVMEKIKTEKKLSDETLESLVKLIEEFKATFIPK